MPITKRTERQHVFTLRVTTSTAEAIKGRAWSLHLSVNEYLKQAVLHELDPSYVPAADAAAAKLEAAAAQ